MRGSWGRRRRRGRRGRRGGDLPKGGGGGRLARELRLFLRRQGQPVGQLGEDLWGYVETGWRCGWDEDLGGVGVDTLAWVHVHGIACLINIHHLLLGARGCLHLVAILVHVHHLLLVRIHQGLAILVNVHHLLLVGIHQGLAILVNVHQLLLVGIHQGLAILVNVHHLLLLLGLREDHLLAICKHLLAIGLHVHDLLLRGSRVHHGLLIHHLLLCGRRRHVYHLLSGGGHDPLRERLEGAGH